MPVPRWFLLVAVVLFAPMPANGQVVLMGVTSSVPGTGPQPIANLVDIDLLTGLASNPRPTGLRVIAGIATHPVTGELYGLTTDPSVNLSNSLVRLDINTGAHTLIGNTGLTIVEGDLAFNPVNGMLYGIQDVGSQGNQRALFWINPLTGSGTVVGDLGAPGDYSSLLFDANGDLYAIDSGGLQNSVLVRIDPMNAQILNSVTMNINLGGGVGMARHPITGIVYVADNESTSTSGGTNSLFTVDLITGQASLIGPTDDPYGIAGLAFVSIPEPSSLLMCTSACWPLVWVWVVRHRQGKTIFHENLGD